MPRLGLGLGLGLNSSLGGPAVALNPPVNTVAPAITGTPTVGQTLTVSNGTWTNSPTGYARQWQRGDSSSGPWTNISGATGTTYTLVSGDATKYVRAVVTATNSDGSNSAPATAVGPVAAQPARTYAEFQARIASIAANGTRSWTTTMAAAGKFVVTAAAATGSLEGSTWGPSSAEGARTVGTVARGVQHALPSQAAFNEQVSQGGQMYVEFPAAALSSAAVPAVTRNGFASSANAGTGLTMTKIIDLIRWDFTLNKAFRSNPSTGTAETEYTW